MPRSVLEERILRRSATVPEPVEGPPPPPPPPLSVPSWLNPTRLVNSIQIIQQEEAMRHLFIYLSAMGAVVSLLLSCQATNDPAKEEWVQLFNGHDLSGWTAKFAGHEMGVNYQNTFVAEDSLLRVSYAEWDEFKGEFGHLFYREKFSHYKLRATYRFTGEQLSGGPGWAVRNNGLMLHCQDPGSMTLAQEFPISLEMQLLGGNGTDDRHTANLCTPGTHVHMSDSLFTPHCVNSSSETYHGDQWVTVEVLVLGDSLLRHTIDGKTVLEYQKPVVDGSSADAVDSGLADGESISDGFISIQAETHPTDFKSIELLDLCGCSDPEAKNYKSYYVKSDNSRCEY